MMAMKVCCDGGVVALASVFSLLSTVSFLWLSLPRFSLVSSYLSFLVFPLFSPFFLCPLARSLEGLIYSLTYLYLGKIQCINSRMQIPADLQ